MSEITKRDQLGVPIPNTAIPVSTAAKSHMPQKAISVP